MQIVLDSSDLHEKAGVFYASLLQGAKHELVQQVSEAYNRIVTGTYWTNRTNRTRKTFKILPVGPLALSLRSEDKIALYLEDGTRPHDIRPKHKAVLAFFWTKVGADVMFGGVRHPGTKALHFTKVEWFRGMADLRKKVDAAAHRSAERSGVS